MKGERASLERARAAIAETDRVLAAVCAAGQVSLATLKGPVRSHFAVRPRQLACWLLRERAKLSVYQIGQLFNRDHSTAMHSLMVAKTLLESDVEFQVLHAAAMERLAQREAA